MHPKTTLKRARPTALVSRAWPIVAVISLLSAPVAAQSNSNRQQARKLAAQGYEALKRKDYSSAEALFRTADSLVHAPTLAVDHARSLIGLGKLVEGHERYAQVLREGVAPTAPVSWHSALVDAEAEFAAVERRLAWLTITIKDAKNPVVEIDGKAVPDAAQGVRRATNPGLRTVSVSADGFLPLQRAITLQEGQSAELELALDRDPNAAPPPVEAPPPPPVLIVAPPRPVSAPDRTLPIVLMSVGGAALVAGGITGVLALHERSELRKACQGFECVPADDSQDSDFRARRDKYRGLGTASGVALAVGAGAALTGLGLLVFTGKSPNSDAVLQVPPATQPSLQVGLGYISLGLSHIF